MTQGYGVIKRWEQSHLGLNDSFDLARVDLQAKAMLKGQVQVNSLC